MDFISKGDIGSNMISLISPDDHWYIKVRMIIVTTQVQAGKLWIFLILFEFEKASARIDYDKKFDQLQPMSNKLLGSKVKPV
jgi:hypothetical protein